MQREEIIQTLLKAAPEKKLSCQKAFDIAAATGCSTKEIGTLCNELEIKIISCRLGCF